MEKDIKEIIKNKFYEKLEFVDRMFAEYNEMEVSIGEQESALSEKADDEITADEVAKLRYDITYILLLKESIGSNYDVLQELYSLCLLGDIDLGLSEVDKRRVEQLDGNEKSFFVIDKSKVVPKDEMIFSVIKNRIEENKEKLLKDYIRAINEPKEDYRNLEDINKDFKDKLRKE